MDKVLIVIGLGVCWCLTLAMMGFGAFAYDYAAMAILLGASMPCLFMTTVATLAAVDAWEML